VRKGVFLVGLSIFVILTFIPSVGYLIGQIMVLVEEKKEYGKRIASFLRVH